MRCTVSFAGAVAILVPLVALGQETLCNPCVDPPLGPRTENFRTSTTPPVFTVVEPEDVIDVHNDSPETESAEQAPTSQEVEPENAETSEPIEE